MYNSNWWNATIVIRVAKETSRDLHSPQTEKKTLTWCVEFDHTRDPEEFLRRLIMLELRKVYRNAPSLKNGKKFQVLSINFQRVDKVVRYISYLG
jgi:hypothetical protein